MKLQPPHQPNLPAPARRARRHHLLVRDVPEFHDQGQTAGLGVKQPEIPREHRSGRGQDDVEAFADALPVEQDVGRSVNEKAHTVHDASEDVRVRPRYELAAEDAHARNGFLCEHSHIVAGEN